MNGCEACRVLGPLLTAPGTSGRTWRCECGAVWSPEPVVPESVDVRTVTIPACDAHAGFAAVRVSLVWRCPRCGGPRGEVYPGISFDGSLRLAVDRWDNPCGHVDLYAAVRREAGL